MIDSGIFSVVLKGRASYKQDVRDSYFLIYGSITKLLICLIFGFLIY